MKKIVLRLKNSILSQKVLYISICIFLGLYFFSIPSFSNRIPWNIISYGLMALLLAATFLYTVFYGERKLDKKVFVPLAFVIYAFLCTVINTRSALRVCLSVLLMALSFIAVLYACKAINNIRLILKILIFAFLAFSIYFVIVPEYTLKILTFKISMKNRLGGYFDNVNLIGSYFAIGFGLSLYLGLINNKKIDYLYCLACLPFAYLGLFTGSRAFIMLIAIFVIAIFYVKLRRKKFIFFITLGAMITLLVFLVIFVAPLREQFDKTIYTIFGIGEPDPKKIDTSTIQRVLWMRYGFALGSKNLIIGLGCDGFTYHSGVGTYTHNNFAEVLCDFGIPGFMFFYFIIIYPFILYHVSKKEYKTIVIPLTFYYLIKSMFGVFYNYKDFYLLIAVCYYVVDDVKFSDVTNAIANRFKNRKTITI